MTAAAVFEDLSQASREGRFRAALTAYLQRAVLGCDEVGYLSCGSDAANVLFHFANARCVQHRCNLFTTNKPLKDWGAALHDYDLAEAIIDRVLERGRIVSLEGPSMRTRHLEGIDYERSPPAASKPASIEPAGPRPPAPAVRRGPDRSPWHRHCLPPDADLLSSAPPLLRLFPPGQDFRNSPATVFGTHRPSTTPRMSGLSETFTPCFVEPKSFQVWTQTVRRIEDTGIRPR